MSQIKYEMEEDQLSELVENENDQDGDIIIKSNLAKMIEGQHNSVSQGVGPSGEESKTSMS